MIIKTEAAEIRRAALTPALTGLLCATHCRRYFTHMISLNFPTSSRRLLSFPWAPRIRDNAEAQV